MAPKDHAFKNVAVPEEDHRRLAMIASHEDRSMARQLAVMIREKFRDLGLESPSTADTTDTAAGRGKKSAKS